MYTRNSGKNISREDVGEALRNVGVMVSAKDLLSVSEDYINFDQFRNLYNELRHRPPPDFSKVFSIIDKDDTGFIPLNELKYILVNVGEGMELDEVEELISLTGREIVEGKINYKEFLNLLCNK